jgi:hypothetical protein
MSVKRVEGHYSVTVRGRLAASDLRRLERACGSALEQQHPPLTVRLEKITGIDESARAYLDRLARRGAEVIFG